MATASSPGAARPTNEMVDVLIIGAGASGAAVAWSLAETRMKILCLEQGDWIKPTDFPTNGRDWEARRYADFDISPNRRARDTDYPINDTNSIMKVANFNGVGGGTIFFTAHYRRLHPSDFRVRTLDGVADDWPIDYWMLEPYFAENDRMTGVAGLTGDPSYPSHQPPLPPVPLGKSGTRYAQAMNLSRGFVRGYTLQFGRGTGPASEAIASMIAGRLPWGADHYRIYRTLFYRRLLVNVACEDLPEEHNRVTLDPILKDGHGIPAPKIDYNISENARRMMEHGIARATEILETAGASNISCSRTLLNSPGHLLGTARMGLNPERSVVNEWGRCHDVKNLFIVDGSIWVTSGGVNPTSTIQALALYIADSIKQRLATLFD